MVKDDCCVELEARSVTLRLMHELLLQSFISIEFNQDDRSCKMQCHNLLIIVYFLKQDNPHLSRGITASDVLYMEPLSTINVIIESPSFMSVVRSWCLRLMVLVDATAHTTR